MSIYIYITSILETIHVWNPKAVAESPTRSSWPTQVELGAAASDHDRACEAFAHLRLCFKRSFFQVRLKKKTPNKTKQQEKNKIRPSVSSKLQVVFCVCSYWGRGEEGVHSNFMFFFFFSKIIKFVVAKQKQHWMWRLANFVCSSRHSVSVRGDTFEVGCFSCSSLCGILLRILLCFCSCFSFVVVFGPQGSFVL